MNIIYVGTTAKISIHSLRVEGDFGTCRNPDGDQEFQSTPSVWRETLAATTLLMAIVFQSTPSVWRETERHPQPHQELHISIHSLRVEGDPAHHRRQSMPRYFNPLPPCGGRLSAPSAPVTTPRFQSTPSVWRETLEIRDSIVNGVFQSTPSVWRETAKLHSFPLKTQQSKCNFDKKEHRYTSPCQKKHFFSDFFTKKRVRIPPAFFVRLGFAPERFLRTKAVPPHRWFPLRRYVPLSSDTDSPDSRTGGYPSRYRWHPSAAV